MHRLGIFLVLSAASFCLGVYGQRRQFHLGRTPTLQELDSRNITVLPDGTGLPPGSATVAQGKKVYESKCSACHGDSGEGRPPLGARLVGGVGTLTSSKPVITIGSYWPYATTIWDYIHRTMPYPEPGTLSTADTYAVTGFLLYRNGIIRLDEIMTHETLPKVQMPNRNGFVPDQRPDVPERARN